MNELLIYFALPIATIIISIALQKILKCPPLVAAVIFAIFLIVTFVINNLAFLVPTIVYTIISFLTAIIVCLFGRFIQENCMCCYSEDEAASDNNSGSGNCNCGRGNLRDIEFETGNNPELRNISTNKLDKSRNYIPNSRRCTFRR